MDFRVVKFGGSSVKDAAAIDQVCRIVAARPKGLCVVLSAMGGITDHLLDAARNAATGKPDPDAADAFRRCYQEAADILVTDRVLHESLCQEISRSAGELATILEGLGAVAEVTPGILDRTSSRGERLMARLFEATLRCRGISSKFIDALDLIAVHLQDGSHFPDLSTTTRQAKDLLMPSLSDGAVCVIPGFYGKGTGGKLVTLGRGGTDLSATTIAHAIRAKEVVLYKEVDGLLTADPKDVPEARIVPELHYREAAELAYYGAKVLHPRTIIPLLTHGIPLVVRNTFRPEAPGTRIAGDVRPGAYPVKALSAVRGQALIAVEGKGMLGVPGIAARTFDALARAQTSVSVISQASSEASICFSVPKRDADGAVKALRETFRFEIEHQLIDDIRVEDGQSVIAVVGMGMRGTPGIAARTFGALGAAKVNIEAIAQGSSELNISLVLDDRDVSRALTALHREFRLEKIRALPPKEPGSVALSVFGFGQIGRTLIRQLEGQSSYFKEKMGLELLVTGLADSSGLLVEGGGIPSSRLEDLALYKEKGESLLGTSARLTKAEMKQRLSESLWSLPFGCGVFCDLTATESADIVLDALQNASHVVLANKKPLAVPQETFDGMFEAARRHGVQLRYEATVGAGLPVLDTLAKLAEAGDEIHSILGCLSGTLGFLMTEIEDGTPFSEAVHKAYRLGYTEPDPREDLSGMDVARKALILARTLGKRLDLADIAVEPLYPKEADKDDPKEFLSALRALDENWNERTLQARSRGEVLRYVARIDPDRVRVGIEGVPSDSSLGRLRGTDNQITIRSARYGENPLIVTGPGAGAAVTAAGVLNDILAIATSQGRTG